MQLNTIQKYYSLDELALMLGCSKNTLRYNPKFPKGIQLSKRRTVYDITEVKAYLESNRVKPSQRLVIAERDELSGKLAKLTEFINSDRFTETVPDERERDRLILQKSIMTAYLDVLNYRIDAFK